MPKVHSIKIPDRKHTPLGDMMEVLLVGNDSHNKINTWNMGIMENSGFPGANLAATAA
jgi:hypothetical protein